MTRCPICYRHVTVTNCQTVMAHTDKAGHACPFSGQQISARRRKPWEDKSRTSDGRFAK
jgi:hypothetical protein